MSGCETPRPPIFLVVHWCLDLDLGWLWLDLCTWPCLNHVGIQERWLRSELFIRKSVLLLLGCLPFLARTLGPDLEGHDPDLLRHRQVL